MTSGNRQSTIGNRQAAIGLRRAGVTLALIALAVSSAAAHLWIPADFREIVSESSLIVRGRVNEVRAIALPGSGIETVATILAENVLKGQPAQFVSVRVPGGVVGNRRSVLTGAPELRAGDRAVFFLKRDTTAGFRLTGLSMGLYRLQGDPGTGRATVTPPIVLMRNSPPGPIVRGDRARTAMSLQQFESLVRLVAAQPPAPRVIRR
jgi:hypothetical protein